MTLDKNPMKEVDFDIIVPEDEPQVAPLEAETTEDNAETALKEAPAEEDSSKQSGKDTKKGHSNEECPEEVRAQSWRQWIIDDDVKFDKQVLKDLVQGISFLSFLRRNWFFVVIIMIFFIAYVSLGYHHRNLMIENDKLNKELLDRRYKALTRSSELRERTLGSKIESQLQDSTIQASTDAPFELPVTDDE